MAARSRALRLGSTRIEDTFAEAFGMAYVRLILTAHDDHWLDAAVRELTGYSASVIACDAEAGRERSVDPSETPDGRPGAAVLLFGFSAEALGKAVPTRVGQCVMTCPTSACYDGLPESKESLPLGKHLRYFGDGFQKSKRLNGTRYWRIPVMDGEFVVQESVGVGRGVGGGNIILQSVDQPTGLAAARRAVQAVEQRPGVIAPFPAGVARSGSKVGSRYPRLVASTADAFCPTLRGRVDSRLDADANCAYEVVIDGASEAEVAAAMTAAIQAAAGEGVVCISASLREGRRRGTSLRGGSRDDRHLPCESTLPA
jgi:formylmethanofuran--tetrahydromethanopterin N-formyltransferase